MSLELPPLTPLFGLRRHQGLTEKPQTVPPISLGFEAIAKMGGISNTLIKTAIEHGASQDLKILQACQKASEQGKAISLAPLVQRSRLRQ